MPIFRYPGNKPIVNKYTRLFIFSSLYIQYANLLVITRGRMDSPAFFLQVRCTEENT